MAQTSDTDRSAHTIGGVAREALSLTSNVGAVIYGLIIVRVLLAAESARRESYAKLSKLLDTESEIEVVGAIGDGEVAARVDLAGSDREQVVDAPSAVRERLEAFGVEVLAGAMNRPVQLRNGGLYMRGLLEHGARKSLEPMVERLGGRKKAEPCIAFESLAAVVFALCRRLRLRRPTAASGTAPMARWGASARAGADPKPHRSPTRGGRNLDNGTLPHRRRSQGPDAPKPSE